jgi:hypothetical protein
MLGSIPVEPPHLTFNIVREFRVVVCMRNNFSCVEGGNWDSVAVLAGCGHHLSDNMFTSEWLSLYEAFIMEPSEIGKY